MISGRVSVSVPTCSWGILLRKGAVIAGPDSILLQVNCVRNVVALASLLS